MKFRIALIVLGAGRLPAATSRPSTREGAQEAPQLDAPAPEIEPARRFARRATTPRARRRPNSHVSVSLRLPDAGRTPTRRAGSADAARRATASSWKRQSPARSRRRRKCGGQTLRALLDIPVEEPQVLVYRVTNETKPEGVGGLCGAERADYVVRLGALGARAMPP